ncbi:MAG: TaqI-like C-terminal specificity domain-containing protein [Acidobacteriota bacterium]
MNRDQARSLIRQTFTEAFDRTRFRNFVINLLNIIDESKAQSWNKTYVKDAFKPGINRYERLGTYTDPAGEKIDILITYLEKESSIERARTFLRNFVADYLATRGQKEAALVAFVSPSEADWRFSLVKMEYAAAEDEAGRIQIAEILTPARRSSFLVGENEDSHTAQAQLVDILADSDRNPTLADLERAFSVERVTKEFWEKYKKLYLDVKDSLDEVVKRDASVRHDFESKGINTVDFAKKLLGQIVFLYFLQKKGWFGVARDEQWGAGPKDFLRQLFNRRRDLGAKKDHFFNHILEPLFYEALARERDEDFYSRFDCKIPFLNGGLFDPLNNYDWVHTDIALADALFSNDDTTAQGDKGTGILDVFDRYNFTVNEAEPLDKEVAVDPEMLGKVFENLLAVKERKSKGSYYTPRAIVHYMCRQSLNSYLETELSSAGVSRDEIERFLRVGEQAADFEMARLAGTESYSPKLPGPVETNAHLIDQKLEEVTVCDPAVGSGAFLVGMMSEIVRARKTLTPYFTNKTKRTAYEFKRHAIQSSLYGVDIDPGAVEIAKLRLWLSLVVDEDDIKQIKPLPNLDYKIMQGDSLVEEFEGIKLLDERLIERPPDTSAEKAALKARIAELSHDFFDLHNRGNRDRQTRRAIEKEIAALKKQIKVLDAPVAAATAPVQREFGDLLSEVQRKLPELRRLHRELFEAASGARKKELREELFALEWEFMDATVRENGDAAALKQLQRLRTLNYKPFFLWKLYFLEVFQNKGGFAVVIGNPPYLGFHGFKEYKEQLKKSFISAKGKFDYYLPFIERGVSLLSSGGVLSFICPTNFTKRGHGAALRTYLRNEVQIREICDFQEVQVFAQALNYTGIFILEKARPSVDHGILYKQRSITDVGVKVRQSDLSDEAWVFRGRAENELVEKVQQQATSRLGEICSGIAEGIVTGLNDVFLMTTAEAKRLGLERDILRTCLRGRQIRRYSLEEFNEVVIYPYRSSNGKTAAIPQQELKRFANVWSYLNSRRKDLMGRPYFDASSKTWYELWCQRDIQQFATSKIVVPELSASNRFALADSCQFYGDTVCGITLLPTTEEHLSYVLGVLNSKLIEFYYKQTTVPKANKFFIYKTMFLKNIPIRRIEFSSVNEESLHTRMVDSVGRMLAAKKQWAAATTESQRSHLEQLCTSTDEEIDYLVYELYELTPDEIRLVEGSAPKANE